MIIGNVFQIIAVLRLTAATGNNRSPPTTSQGDAANFQEPGIREEIRRIRPPPNVVAPRPDIAQPSYSSCTASTLESLQGDTKEMPDKMICAASLSLCPHPPTEQRNQKDPRHAILLEATPLNNSHEQEYVFQDINKLLEQEHREHILVQCLLLLVCSVSFIMAIVLLFSLILHIFY